jgi:uncharacterized protein (DUF1778 family)
VARNNRTERLEVRLTPEEKELFDDLANLHGMRLSEYVRNMLCAMRLELQVRNAA